MCYNLVTGVINGLTNLPLASRFSGVLLATHLSIKSFLTLLLAGRGGLILSFPKLKKKFHENRTSRKKVMTTCIMYDVIVISVYYANFKNCCKSQFLTDFDNSGWK